MFHTGDYVMYAGSGLCLVENVGVPSFQAANSPDYYFLRKASDNSRIYVPVDTPLPIRSPMTREEAERLLSDLRGLRPALPEKRDQKTIVRVCREALQQQTVHAAAQVIQLLHAVHPNGKISGAEETLLKKAECALREELAYALCITATEADCKLRAALQGGEE